MNLEKKEVIKSLGDRLSFVIVINFYIWLFVAMIEGGQVTVYFNHFGEALLEYIVYIIIFPIMLYALIWDLKVSKRKRKLRRELRAQEKR